MNIRVTEMEVTSPSFSYFHASGTLVHWYTGLFNGINIKYTFYFSLTSIGIPTPSSSTSRTQPPQTRTPTKAGPSGTLTMT